MAPPNNIKKISILAFGNSNSGKAELLKSIMQTDPASSEYVLASQLDVNGNVELLVTNKQLAIRVLDATSAGDEREGLPQAEGKPTIMFVVNVADYDQILPENETCNRLQADFDLFDSIVNSSRFMTARIILIFTHTDEFIKKLDRIPMRNYFSDYMDGPDYLMGLNYVVSKFVGRSPEASLPIYAHIVSEEETNILDFLIKTTED